MFRPTYHFTPPQGWMNDPNGLVFFQGEYHLFFQHIPDSHEHGGRLHWGHAVSPDLVHWQPLPPALYPDELGDIWSGCAVIDRDNSSGLQSGQEAVMAALFTHAGKGGQQQSLATSQDRGRSWQKYAGNPVIPNPGLKDFRDPNVIWHEESGRWAMVLAAGNQLLFYTSPDLKQWSQSGAFGQGYGAHGGVWECPSLLRLPLPAPETGHKWLLLVSVGGGAPNGGPGTQYFLGHFDGQTFRSDGPPGAVRWLDYGRDNYAAIPFRHLPPGEQRALLLGWMANWQYAVALPTAPWRGAMTLPRELRLVPGAEGGYRLASRPVAELRALRGRQVTLRQLPVQGQQPVPAVDGLLQGGAELRLELEPGPAQECGLIFGNGLEEESVVGYDVARRQLFLDRRRSGATHFSPEFAPRVDVAGPLPAFGPDAGTLHLHLFLDRCSLELFAGDGQVVMSELLFPTRPYDRLRLYSRGGPAHLRRLDAWSLRPAL